jgi:putative membrane protein
MILEYIKLICTGIALGITVIIPGISAGTMAVVFNVYDRLIGIITPNIKKILAEWKFWLPLILGIAAGIFFFSKAVTLLYENHPVLTVWFFIGVITGSLPLVYNRVRQPDSVLPSFGSTLCAILALAVMIIFTIIKPVESSTLYTELTVPLFGMLFLGGILGAIAMIIPGISGAFLLLVIGLYRTVLQAVADMNILLIIPLALGAVVGLLTGAAFVRFLLSKAPKETYGAVLGLVAGSVIVLFPGSFGEGITIIFSIIGLLSGTALSFFFSSWKKNTI